MFGWIKKRMRREQIKLVKQSILAGEYLHDIQENAISAGLMERDRFESVVDMNLETSKSHLETLKKYNTLPQLLLDGAIGANKGFRREYDQVLSGRVAFAAQFGSASERLLPFDQMFTPNEGWRIYYSHFGDAKEDV